MCDETTLLVGASSTPAGAGRRRTRFTLPPQQLAKARSRLAFLAGLFTCMCILAVVVEMTLYRNSPTNIWPVFVFNGVTSALLFLSTRIKRLPDRAVLNLGLVHEILMCLSVSMGFVWAQFQRTGTPPMVTWVCVVMVAFPLIIPTPPTRTFWAALTAAATVPTSLGILHLFEWATPQPFDYVEVSISPAFCILLAILGSRVIYGLNVEVARARQLGSYQLVELLGRGGMGEVWRAKHRLLARPAAVKLVRPEIQRARSAVDNERLLERFKREAEVTAGLQSPHTVSLYDFGITDEGVFYYVMELLTGLDLETLVRESGPLSPERTVHILLQACHSLREAHDQALIHRDIKPANLILCRRRAGDYDFVKVLDFGLVALRPEAHPDSARLTEEGSLGGTPAYMPPEAVTEERVDARADIYSLGCVAYWLLTGRAVFEAKTPMKTVLSHVRDAPVPPSQRAKIEIPAALEQLVLDCLEKDPDHRPQSAEDLANALRAIDLAAAWTQETARQWWERHERAAPGEVGAAATLDG